MLILAIHGVIINTAGLSKVALFRFLPCTTVIMHIRNYLYYFMGTGTAEIHHSIQRIKQCRETSQR